MATHESFLRRDSEDVEELQEKFDSSWGSDVAPYRPETAPQLSLEQQEKIGREVLYRTTGIHEDAAA